jgi:hypothetical protein
MQTKQAEYQCLKKHDAPADKKDTTEVELMETEGEDWGWTELPAGRLNC